MGIRVSYGDRSGIDEAISKGIIPKDSFIIGTYEDNEAELMFYDRVANIRHIVAQTRFDSKDAAVEYAISHSEVGNTITVLDGGVYTAYVVQPDFSLRELGMGKFRPETIEELVSGVSGLTEEIEHINSDIASISENVDTLKGEVNVAKESIDILKQDAHTHENKSLLDTITEDRILKWDIGISDATQLPVATETNKGAVRSTSKENGVTVLGNGTMEVNSLSISKLVQDADSTVIVCGGSATE